MQCCLVSLVRTFLGKLQVILSLTATCLFGQVPKKVVFLEVYLFGRLSLPGGLPIRHFTEYKTIHVTISTCTCPGQKGRYSVHVCRFHSDHSIIVFFIMICRYAQKVFSKSNWCARIMCKSF